MPPTKGYDALRSVLNALDRYKTAREEFTQALEDEKQISDLGRKADGKTQVLLVELREKAVADWERSPAAKKLADKNPELWAQSRTNPEVRAQCAFNAGYAPDPAELSRLIHNTPEQQEIESIRQSRKQAGTTLEILYREMQPDLDSLRSQETHELFDALDGLFPAPTQDNTARRISLVEQIVRRSGTLEKPGRRRMRRADPREAEQIADLKKFIRQVHAELIEAGKKENIHKRICKRLHNHPRPPGAIWKDLPWPKAYDNPKYQRSVRAWISKAIHEPD